jgi:hypothetical protein
MKMSKRASGSLTSLTPEDVLSTPAEFDHSTEIRSMAPAIVLVLEREAPIRLELLASTEAEHAALREECRSNPRWAEVLDGYFAAKDDEDDFAFQREDRHAQRLDAGTPLSTLRVDDV